MLLEDRLCQLSVGADREKMYSQWNIIKNRVESKLDTVCNHFPHFSKHDGTHSQTIATYIGNLLGEDRVNKLSYSDIFMMLLSFYHHDVGMALEYEKIYEYFHTSAFQNTLSKYANDQTSDLCDVARRLLRFGTTGATDYETSIDVYNDVILVIEDIYRTDHAKRSADAIMKDDLLESVLHIRCQRILADICEVHQKPISNIANLPWKENGFFGDYFHPRLIGAMLCLGDLLDLDTDRFDEIAMNASTPFPKLSKLHLDKHKSVHHFLVDRNVIEVSANMDHIEVYRVMRKWMDWMQEACDYITMHWSEIAPENFGNAPRITKCELLLNGNTKWLPFSNTKYEISDKRMFELLRGNKIYKNKFVCIREIIQNSVDATLLRLFDEKILNGDEDAVLQQLRRLTWDNYQICGEIEVLDKTRVCIKIRDRGIGISIDDIKKIANVSNIASSKRKELISQMPVWLRPSGAFGMGLQSIFLLTDQFEIVTKTNDEAAKKIVFQSMETSDGYITVQDYEGTFTQGTELSFVIDGEKLTAEELYCSSYHYKQKDLSRFVVNRIFYDYENQSSLAMQRQKNSRKTTDYVPVEIQCILPPDEKIHKLLEYKPFFTEEELGERGVKVEHGLVEIKKFIPQLNCYINCRLNLTGDYRKTKKEHCYGEVSDMHRYTYRNAIFYRNTYVCDEVLHNSFSNKMPLISYMDWRINLLDATSDEVLKINRNAINEEYADIFYKKLNSALEMATEDAIDYLVDETINDGEEMIGDTALILYQLAVQLDYRVQEFYSKYENVLNQIKIDNYFVWKEDKASPELVIKNFKELRQQPLYFIAGKVEHIPDDVQPINLDKELCLQLNQHGHLHLLSHKMIHVFLGEKDGVYVKGIKVVPFEYNTPDNLYQMDDLFILENLIRKIAFNLRVIPAVKGYEILITPINLSSEWVFHSYEKNDPYYIEMPFSHYLQEMEDLLRKDAFIPNAIDRYKDLVIKSELFEANVDYIVGITGEQRMKVRDKYESLVTKCLELLGDEKYKEFNQDILRATANKNPDSFRSREPIEYNPYITYKDVQLTYV